MTVPLGLVQLALLLAALGLAAAALASGTWNGLALLSLAAFLTLIATTQKAAR